MFDFNTIKEVITMTYYSVTTARNIYGFKELILTYRKNKTKKKLQKTKVEKENNENWTMTRDDHKRVGKQLMTELSKLDATKNNRFIYAQETNMIYRIAFGMTAKEYMRIYNINYKDSIRNHMSEEQLKLIKDLEELDTKLIMCNFNYEYRKNILEKYYQNKKCR